VSYDLCIFCSTRPSDEGGWHPYCGAECAIEAHDDPYCGLGVIHGVMLGAKLRPAWERLQKDKRSCWPKVQHDSELMADKHVQALAARRVGGNLAALRSYHCETCGMWHVGHQLHSSLEGV